MHLFISLSNSSALAAGGIAPAVIAGHCKGCVRGRGGLGLSAPPGPIKYERVQKPACLAAAAAAVFPGRPSVFNAGTKDGIASTPNGSLTI